MNAERRLGKETIVRLLFLSGVLVVAVIAGLIFFRGDDFVTSDNAYLKSNRVSISSEVGGRLAQVFVKENQQVQTGELLFSVDSEPYRIVLAETEADLVDELNQLQATQARFRESEARILKAEEDYRFAEREYDRISKLATKKMASESQLDQASHDREQNRQIIASLQQERAALLAELGGEPTRPLEEHARYLAARAKFERAQLDLNRCDVRAPTSGLVTQLDRFRPGDFVQPGQPLFALVESDELWVEANLKETELEHVRPGQSVDVEIDAYPDYRLKGAIESIGAATGSEFSVLPPQNATGNWIKVTQRIPVRISLHSPENAPALRLGMSAKVAIDVRKLPVVTQSKSVAKPDKAAAND